MRSAESTRNAHRGHLVRGKGSPRPAATRDLWAIREEHTSGAERSPARQFVAQRGHWILAALLVILFARLYGHEDVPVRPRELDAPANSLPDHLGAPLAESLPIAEVSPSPQVAASETNENAMPRDEAGQGHEQASGTMPEAISLMIEPSDNGAYYLRGTINQQDVLFLIDTGASWIAIPERLRYLLKLARGRYVQVSTAGGVVGNYETVIDSLALGPLQFRNVSGVLNPHAPNDVVLLGMSALKDIRMVQSDGRLTLTQQSPPAVVEPARSRSASEPGTPRRALRECSQPGQVIDRSTLECMEGRTEGRD